MNNFTASRFHRLACDCRVRGALAEAVPRDNELGAFTFAPSSTPTPSLSTSSPPNHPVTVAMATATRLRTNASVLGTLLASPDLISQLTANNATTTTFPPP